MNELQMKLLSVFSYFHDTCQEHGLVYYASGGTLLGAVRHNGFIPWDDDIDVWMPRPDYEKLTDLIGGKRIGNYLLETPRCNTGNHYYAMGKLYDASTTLIEKTKFRVKKGIYLDIFPIDGVGNTQQEVQKRFSYMRRKNMLMSSRISVPRKGRSAIKNLGVYVSSLIPEAIVDTSKMIAQFDEECKKVRFGDCKYVGILMGAYGMKDIVPKEWLGEPALYDFETIKVCSVKDYDQMLTYIYGDWRQLPPKEKQVTTHDYYELDLSKDFMQ